jgi:hypothetical protein
LLYYPTLSPVFTKSKKIKKIQNKSSNPLPFQYKHLSLIIKTNKTMDIQEKRDEAYKRIGVALVKALFMGIALGSFVTWLIVR